MHKVETVEAAISFLEEAAKYFANRDTKGEDRAYWANVYNSENCLAIVKFIKENNNSTNFAYMDKDYEIERLKQKLKDLEND